MSVVSSRDCSQAYDEGAFQYFLAVERERSKRSNHACVLLLVELAGPSAAVETIAPPVAEKVFAILERTLRETDFVGWYRHRRVVGAVLTQFSDAPEPDRSRVVVERVRRALDEDLPIDASIRLQVRVQGLS